MAGLNYEITQVEISRVLVAMRPRRQHTYGLAEVGDLLSQSCSPRGNPMPSRSAIRCAVARRTAVIS